LATNEQHNGTQQVAAIPKCLWRQQNIYSAVVLTQAKEALEIVHLS